MNSSVALRRCSLLTLGIACLLQAADPAPPQPKSAPDSAEFKKMKSLIGTWRGQVDMGQGPVDMTFSTE